MKYPNTDYTLSFTTVLNVPMSSLLASVDAYLDSTINDFMYDEYSVELSDEHINALKKVVLKQLADLYKN